MQKQRGSAKKALRNSNSTYLVTFFLEKGADINHGAADGWTPLMYAIQEKNLENVKLLLERGADVKKADKDGKTLPELFGNTISKEEEKFSILLRVSEEIGLKEFPAVVFFPPGGIEADFYYLSDGIEVYQIQDWFYQQIIGF